jgi:N-acetylglutamate synthase-like GNAT family acetyltransferase
MNPIYLFRQAEEKDIPAIWKIILQAKEQMRKAGSQQWQDGYPNMEIIQKDIARNSGFVLCHKSEVIAYGSIIRDGEPSYKELKGHWLSDIPYIVVHRLAVADEMKHQGVATYFFRQAEQFALSLQIRSFRVDTNFDNRYMLHLLEKLEFTYCGEVSYGERGDRLAYEKLL